MPNHYYILSILIIISFYTDIKSTKIPNILTGAAVGIAFLYYFIINGWSGLLFSLAGFCTGFGILLILYFVRAIGAGDVKLFGAIGALMGIEFTLYSMMYAVVYAGLIGLCILLVRRELVTRLMNILFYFIGIITHRNLKSMQYCKKDALTFPFMYAVLPAILTTCYYYLI